MKPRQVQHRPERQAAQGRELAAARREIKQLKKLVARLQKTIGKMADQRGEPVEIDESDPTLAEIEAIEPAAPEVPGCKDCGSTDLKTFTTPSGKILTICGGCKARS